MPEGSEISEDQSLIEEYEEEEKDESLPQDNWDIKSLKKKLNTNLNMKNLKIDLSF